MFQHGARNTGASAVDADVPPHAVAWPPIPLIPSCLCAAAWVGGRVEPPPLRREGSVLYWHKDFVMYRKPSIWKKKHWIWQKKRWIKLWEVVGSCESCLKLWVVVRSCATSCEKLWEVVRSCYKLWGIVRSCEELKKQKLWEVVGSCEKLWEVASNSDAPNVTVNAAPLSLESGCKRCIS